MNETVIVDAGPLVAYLDRSDQHHEWAVESFSRLNNPLQTCEAVMAEAWHLLRRGRINPDHLLALVKQGALIVQFDLTAEIDAVRLLIRRYVNVPMSLADACLVRMSELQEPSRVMTVDSDFVVYRRHGRQTIPLLSPFSAA
jgi:predicted nucleic acid-binding protein